MAKAKTHTAEQVVSLLRQIEVAVAERQDDLRFACHEGGITEQTYYRWRKGVWWLAGGPGTAWPDSVSRR